MSLKKYRLAMLGAIASIAFAPMSLAALASYNQNFEGLNAADPNALANDGWNAFGNVFNSGGGFLFGYGPFGAPNGGPGFSGVISGQGGPTQGAQQLSIYNDYNCCQPANGHFNGTDLVESNVFQEQIVGTGDIGTTWEFSFDAKEGDLTGGTTALAFIKTLDPNAGFQTTNFITLDMTNLTNVWDRFAISLFIDASLDGQILQFGFASTASNFTASQNIYDNVNFSQVPVPGALVLMLSGLAGFLGLRRKG